MLHAELLSALAVDRRRDLQAQATSRWCLGRLARRRPQVVETPNHPTEGAPTMEQTDERVERTYLKAA
jgi:hypothetical protein